jgi:hypothetical protein
MKNELTITAVKRVYCNLLIARQLSKAEVAIVYAITPEHIQKDQKTNFINTIHTTRKQSISDRQIPC